MYGNLGQATNFNQNNLAQNAAMNQNQQASMAAQQQAAAAQQAQLAALYGPQGFGGQTDYYSGLGAAYGRGTGYYGDTFGVPPGQAPLPGGYPSGTVTQGPDLPNLSLPTSPFVGGGYQDPWAGTKWANTTPYNDYGLDNTFSATGNVGQSPGMAPGYGGFNNPAVPTSPQQWYANGGYNPYDPATYGGAAQQNLGQGFPGMGTPTGAGSGGYDPQMGGSSSFPKGMQAQDWNNYFSTAAAPAAGGKGGGWEAEYLLANPDVMAAAGQAGGNVNAFADQHYRDYGQKEGRSVFDANAYLQENPDVFAAGVNPFEHYNQYGRNEGRAAPMSGTFDPANYLALNPDVAAAGVDPLAHWYQYGQNEGRSGGFAMNEPNTPAWQTAIDKAYRDPAAFDAIKNTAFGQIDPAALAALFNEESRWNPRNQTGQQYGIAQMAKDDFNYRGAPGTLGGLTFDQYRNAPAADQIGAYADLLARIQGANPNLDFSQMTPQRQYAVLQALNFGPYTGEPGTIDWIKAMNEGNISMPTTNAPQAKDLGDRSIAAMEQAYLRKAALLPRP
jgi:hypothetical protein